MTVTTVLGCAACPAFFLARMWLSSIRSGKIGSALVWATTITWTLLLNVYVPVYDSILVVLSTVATAAVMKNFARTLFGTLCALIFGGAWVSVQIAERTGIQILTILLAALGTLQLYICDREIAISARCRDREINSPQSEEVRPIRP